MGPLFMLIDNTHKKPAEALRLVDVSRGSSKYPCFSAKGGEAISSSCLSCGLLSSKSSHLHLENTGLQQAQG